MRGMPAVALPLFFAALLLESEVKAFLPPPVQPGYCGATMCVDAGVIAIPGRSTSPTFTSSLSPGLGEIIVSYQGLGSVTLRLDEAKPEECRRPAERGQPAGASRYSYRKPVSIAKPFMRYRGPLCRRITVTVDGATADAARHLQRSVSTLWLLADRDLYFEDDRNILMPFDARVELNR